MAYLSSPFEIICTVYKQSMANNLWKLIIGTYSLAVKLRQTVEDIIADLLLITDERTNIVWEYLLFELEC